MSPEPQSERALLHAWLDGELDAEGRARMERALASSPEFAREAARTMRLHHAIALSMESRAAQPVPKRRTWRWLAAASLLLCSALAWTVATGAQASAAQVELVRLAEAASRGDRTFAIRALDDGPPAPERDGRPGPELDGARLYLRGTEQYVLARENAQGERTLTGFDGELAWTVPPRGAVRVSSDRQRFRGGLPGHQHELPFVDLDDGLANVARNYDLTLERELELDGRPVARIDGVRKRGVERGPKRIELWYEPQSRQLRRIVLDRLPQARSGPRAVALEFVDARPLPADFFDHSHHHGPERAVERDDRPR